MASAIMKPPGTYEIVESPKEAVFEVGAASHGVTKLVHNYTIEDNINQLFEAIDVRSLSKNVSPSHRMGRDTLQRNPSKRPIRVGSSPATGIGISEPLSLKQALRGLCISQASEMAAMKRLAKPSGLSGFSEAGTIKKLYRAVVVEANNSSIPLSEGKGNFVEFSLVPEPNVNSSEKMPETEILVDSISSAALPEAMLENAEPSKNIAENEIYPLPTNIRSKKSRIELEKNGSLKPGHSLSSTQAGKRVLEVDEDVSASFEIKNEPQTGEQISKLDPSFAPSCSGTGSKVGKSANNSPPLLRPAFRNKNFIKKNVKQDSSCSSSNRSELCKMRSDSVSDPSMTSKFDCETQNCSPKSEKKESKTRSPLSASYSLSSEATSNVLESGATKPNECSSSDSRAKASVTDRLRSKEKGEISQNSKSSIGDCSSNSTTSISEDSSFSGSSCGGNRPHMSNDLRWEAIHRVQRQHGSLSLRQFKLVKRLGCGDIGTVYLAELSNTNCLFALKVMDNEFLASRKKLPRAQTEREILQMLDHPFLPTLYAHFATEKLSCLVMEYCPGGDLHVLRQMQPGRYFSEQAARFYVAEVLLALEYLHMLGVVYRDLKPENILVREDGHIMLSDFDLSLRSPAVNPTLLKSSSPIVEPAKKISSPCSESSCIHPFCLQPSWQVPCFTPKLLSAAAKTRKLKADLAAQMSPLPQLVAEPTNARSNSFVGTHEYLAPEIIKGDGHGSAVDWWTFGIFLYELLYGTTPFKGSGNDETLVNVVSRSLRFPGSPIVSFHARDLIRGLLVKDPENRLGSVKGAAEIKQHAFFDGLNWALIRCAIPPELPKSCDGGLTAPATASLKKDGIKCVKDKKAIEENVEFELF